MNNGIKSPVALDSLTAACIQDALKADTAQLFQLMQDSNADLLKTAIRNPGINEAHLLALLERRDLDEELLRSTGNTKAAKESHAVKLAIAAHHCTSSVQLAEILPHLYLFDLVALCTLPGVSHDQKIAAERAIIHRLPATPLGNKVTLAHRATSSVVEQLLREADSRLMPACLDNPHLKEGAVFQFLRSAASTPETISMIARHTRWHNIPNLRLAILTNPRTPLVWFTHWMHSMKTPEIRNIFNSQRLSQMQRREVLVELERRGGGRKH